MVEQQQLECEWHGEPGDGGVWGGGSVRQPAVANQNYSYDPLNRLVGVNDTYYSRGFHYDEFGNMSVAANSGVTLSGLTPYSGNGVNPFSAATNRLVSATYGYDPRGDVTTQGTTTITYDAEGNQISTADSGVGGQSISYIFDAEGQRVGKQTAGGATIVDVHDAFGRLAAEYNSVGVTPACTTCYLFYDGVGSVRLVTDQSGNVVGRHDYLPFGEEIPDGTAGRSGNFGYTTNIAQGFTGQEADYGTVWLDYFNARHMAAVMGSFTQPDPMQAEADFLNPQSWNAYAYVLGNPLGLVDPSGMDSTYSGMQTGVCPASQQTCPTGNPSAPGGPGFPNELEVGYQAYATTVAQAFWGYQSSATVNYGGGGSESVSFASLYQSLWASWILSPSSVGITSVAGGPGGGTPSSPPKKDPKEVDAEARCVNGLILGGVTAGFSDFLGIGPDPDPTGDFTQPARDALRNPAVKVAAAVAVSSVFKRVATRRLAVRAAAALSEDVIPVAGQLLLAYQVGHAVYSGLRYYTRGIDSGACGNP